MMSDNESILFFLFGLPTWGLVDGTWAALSQLADKLPEGYSISAYLMLSLTIGNLVPLFLGYYLKTDDSFLLKRIISVILFLGMTSGIFLSVFWDSTVTISTSDISLPLFILFFIIGVCSSSSNVTHFTYVSHTAAFNTTSLATGMGLGSMIAGTLAIIQGVWLSSFGFSVGLFYLVLSFLYIPAMFSFSYLVFYHKSSFDQAPILIKDSEYPYSEQEFLDDYRKVLILQVANSSLGYGLGPSIISTVCGKFSNATLVLLLSTGIAAVVDPIFKGLTDYIRVKSYSGLKLLSFSLIFLCFGLIICLLFPSNFYQNDAAGALPVIFYVTFCGLFGFCNTSIFRFYKDKVPHNCIKNAYRWGGMATQFGALMGTLISFTLVVSGILG